MRAVVQRVSKASVAVDGITVGSIERGALLFLGVSNGDSEAAADYVLDKVLRLRIFEDAEGKMNLSLADVDGGLLVVSQFTLYGDTRRGARPSFVKAAPGHATRPLYEYFVKEARGSLRSIATGIFGAMMNVELINDGPVTIIFDSERTI